MTNPLVGLYLEWLGVYELFFKEQIERRVYAVMKQDEALREEKRVFYDWITKLLTEP